MSDLDIPDELIDELAKADLVGWTHEMKPLAFENWEETSEDRKDGYRASALAVVKRFLEYVNEQ